VSVPARVTVVTLGVDDLAHATAFYGALGWRLSSAAVEGDVSFFRTGGCVVALWGRGALAADTGIEAGPSPGFRGVAMAINVASEAEVDAALGAAVDAGGRLVKPGTSTEWGGYVGYFADPEGHIWEVTHNPHWQLDDNGGVVLPD
jgi:predicted lactoylglutathione lyase